MKKNVHPKYKEVTATCSCGNLMKIKSTINHNFNLDICGRCHPFYTGKQHNIAFGARVDRFKQKFNFYSKKNDNN